MWKGYVNYRKQKQTELKEYNSMMHVLFKKKVESIVKFIIEPIRTSFFFYFLITIIPTTMYFFLIGGLLYKNWNAIEVSFLHFCLAFFVTYLFSTIVLFSKSTVVKFVLYIFSLSLLFTNLFLKFVFDTTLCPLVVLMIGETNVNESVEFVKTFLFHKGTLISFCVCAAVSLLILTGYWLKRINISPKDNKIRCKYGEFFLVFFLFVGLFQAKTYLSLVACKNTSDLDKWAEKNDPFSFDTITNFLYATWGPVVAKEEIDMAILNTKRGIDEATQNGIGREKVNIILIIGESFNKHHSNLYGYANVTSPLLSAEYNKGNLSVFTDVIAPFNHTTEVVKNIFSCNALSSGEYWFEKPFFPAILKKAGFNIYMMDNQKYWGINSNSTFSLNSFLYNKELSSLSYSYQNKDSYQYDEGIVQEFEKCISVINDDNCNFMIFHLLGQHIAPEERYPHNKKFNRFTWEDYQRSDEFMTKSKIAAIAHYDNATLYNDYVVSRIIEIFREKNSVIIYFSDHGEEVYDYRDSRGRARSDDVKNYMKNQFEIPFFIWCSDTYISKHPNKVKMIKESVEKPFMTDVVCNMIFNLANVKTCYYSPSCDVLNPEFELQSQRIVSDGVTKYDYNQYK